MFRGQGSRENRFAGRQFKLKLKHVIVGAVLWSIALAEIAIIAPAIFLWQREEISRIERTTLDLLKANVDVTTFPSVADTVKIIQRLATFSDVRGGVVLNSIGDELGQHGLVPSLTWHAARREGRRQLASPDGRFLDVFYPVEETGLANPLILRLDATKVPERVVEQLMNKMLVILGVALFSGIIVALLLTRWIVRPVIRLRDAAMSATDNPDKADHFRLKWSRGDELGDAARAFDLLLTAVSIVHQEDLAASQEAIQRSSFAILAYDPNGRLMSGNAAALKLFGCSTLDELAQLPAQFVRTASGNGSVDLSPVELVSRGDFSQIAQIVTPRGVRRCVVNATAIRKKSGAVMRYSVALVDVTKQLSYSDHLEGECRRLQDETLAQKRRLAEMRGLFESCLVIMNAQSGADADPAPVPVPDEPTLTDRVVNTCHAEAQRSGLVQGKLVHSVLPNVRVSKDATESIFRQALMLIYARSDLDTPVLGVEASDMGGGYWRFEVCEGAAPASAAKRSSNETTAAGLAITRMGLSRTVVGAGGAMLSLEGNDFRNVVAFKLPAIAPVREAAKPTPPSLAAAGVEDAFVEPKKKRYRSLRG